jgi:hypothetical protein
MIWDNHTDFIVVCRYILAFLTKMYFTESYADMGTQSWDIGPVRKDSQRRTSYETHIFIHEGTQDVV